MKNLITLIAFSFFVFVSQAQIVLTDNNGSHKDECKRIIRLNSISSLDTINNIFKYSGCVLSCNPFLMGNFPILKNKFYTERTTLQLFAVPNNQINVSQFWLNYGKNVLSIASNTANLNIHGSNKVDFKVNSHSQGIANSWAVSYATGLIDRCFVHPYYLTYSQYPLGLEVKAAALNSLTNFTLDTMLLKKQTVLYDSIQINHIKTVNIQYPLLCDSVRWTVTHLDRPVYLPGDLADTLKINGQKLLENKITHVETSNNFNITLDASLIDSFYTSYKSVPTTYLAQTDTFKAVLTADSLLIAIDTLYKKTLYMKNRWHMTNAAYSLLIEQDTVLPGDTASLQYLYAPYYAQGATLLLVSYKYNTIWTTVTTKTDNVIYYSIAHTCFESSQVVPVELLTFTAKAQDEDVLLQWKTASEINNDYFEIQHSLDGVNFETIGTVKGAGTTYEVQEYLFIDKMPKNGLNYYRLRQIDYDSLFEYTDVISVDFSKNNKIYGNIIKNQLSILGNGKAVIYNQLGQVKKVLQLKEDNILTVDVSTFKTGFYYIKMQNETLRFVKI